MPIWWDGRLVQFVENPRPWNGRALTDEEIMSCAEAFNAGYWRTGSVGIGAQEAYEWLSTHAW